MIFSRIIFSAMLIGVMTGSLMTALQIFSLNPIIFAAESYEIVEHQSRMLEQDGNDDHGKAWTPEDGAVRTALAAELKLGDSTFCWHNERSMLLEFTSLLTRISGSLAKMAEDFILATRPEVTELRLMQGGGSSTMPHKNNPVVAETLVSLFRMNTAMDGLMTQAMLHRQQRDGVAWAVEWHALPQVCMATAKSLSLAHELARELEPDATAMEARLGSGNGLVYAEAISFKLAETLPRSEAQDQVKRLCAQALERGCSLSQLVAQNYPHTDWSAIATPAEQLGDAPQQARAFAARVRQL
jgi:3-carboxy-cis,cis-muconate cycloisomerase